MRCIWQENKLHVWILLQPIGFFNWTDLCVTSQILLYATNRSRKWYSACRHKQNNPKYRRSVLKLRDWELCYIDVLPTSIVKINELRRQVMVAISPQKHNNRKHRNIGQSTTIRRGSRPCQSYCQNLFVHKRLNWKKNCFVRLFHTFHKAPLLAEPRSLSQIKVLFILNPHI